MTNKEQPTLKHWVLIAFMFFIIPAYNAFSGNASPSDNLPQDCIQTPYGCN